MAAFRDIRRVAPWWICALALLITAFFGWVIYEQLGKSVKSGVFSHVLIPPYGVWVFLVLGCLLNRESVLVTADGIVVSNGPIPFGPREDIPREQIAFCYHYGILTTSDGGNGESFAIGHVIGVETREGRQVVLLQLFDDINSARDAARAIAAALNAGSVGRQVDVKVLAEARTDPVGQRRAWVWAGVWTVALIAGIAWEIVHRWRP